MRLPLVWEQNILGQTACALCVPPPKPPFVVPMILPDGMSRYDVRLSIALLPDCVAVYLNALCMLMCAWQNKERGTITQRGSLTPEQKKRRVVLKRVNQDREGARCALVEGRVAAHAAAEHHNAAMASRCLARAALQGLCWVTDAY